MDETTDAAILPEPVLAYEQRTVSPYVIVWCRLLAIICFGFGVERGLLFFGVALFGTGYSFSRGAAWPSIASGVVFCTLWPVLGWLLWARAPQFAVRLSHGSSSAEPTVSTADQLPTEILAVALLAIAVYEISEALPTLVNYFISYGRRIQNLSDLPWHYFTPPLIRIGIGLCLVGGNRRITAYLRGWSVVPPVNDELDENPGRAV